MAYADVDDLRRHLGYGDHYVADDDAMSTALAAAIEAVNDYCGRTFGTVSTSAARIFDGGTTRCGIDDAATVTLVEQSTDRQTWTTVAATDWWTEPANSTPKKAVVANLPLSRHVRVTGTWGHGATVPPQVKLATLYKAARLLKRKDSPLAIEGGEAFGPVYVSRREDPDVVLLLDPLRRADVVFGLA